LSAVAMAVAVRHGGHDTPGPTVAAVATGRPANLGNFYTRENGIYTTTVIGLTGSALRVHKSLSLLTSDPRYGPCK
jgi:hypothetical protein